MRRTGTPIGLVVILVLVLAAPAFGHASLVEAMPADREKLDTPPDNIVLSFDDELEASESSMTLIGPDGDVATGGVDLDNLDHNTMVITNVPALPDAHYEVVWNVLSALDGDVTSGSTMFTVGDPPINDAGVGMWILIGALVLGMGAMVVIGRRRSQAPA